MEDEAVHVRTIYSHKKHGPQVPQVLNSVQINVEPRSAEKYGRNYYDSNSGQRFNHDHEGRHADNWNQESFESTVHPAQSFSSGGNSGDASQPEGIRGGARSSPRKIPPAVPPRGFQLKSNVYASDNSSGDHGTKSTFVPRIPKLSPNSFSSSWQKEAEEPKLQNEVGDGQRQEDWNDVELSGKLPASSAAASEDRKPKPEPEVFPKISDERDRPSLPKPSNENEDQKSTPDEYSVMPKPDTGSVDSSPAISRSTSTESLPSELSNENIRDLFTVQDLDSIHTRRLQERSEAAKKFYSIQADNVYRLHQSAVQNNLELFALTPVAMGLTLKCRVTRDKRGLDRNVFPNYYMHLEVGNSRRILILTARKRKKSTTSNYLISVDPIDLARDSDSYVGKLRSNLMGTQFTIYDNGNSPKRFNYRSLALDTWKYREELGTVTYDTSFIGFHGPRKMKINIPSMLNESQRLEIRPEGKHDTIAELVKRDERSGMTELRNRTPIWKQSHESYILNFKGRVSRSSVKNFQIVHPKNEKYIVLQFGRSDDTHFTLDFNYPLCPLQAFAIALTSFEHKISYD